MPHKQALLTCFMAIMLSAMGLPVAAATLTFEGLPADTSITNQIPGVTISASGGIGEAWVYNTAVVGADPDLTAPHTEISGGPTLNNTGNILIVQENAGPPPDDAGAGGSLYLVFDSAVTLQSIDVFDMAAGSKINLFSDAARTALIASINLLETDTSGPPNFYQHLVFGTDATNVRAMEVMMMNSGGIDNLTYVPLPAAAWLFGSAILGLTIVSRRRK